MRSPPVWFTARCCSRLCRGSLAITGSRRSNRRKPVGFVDEFNDFGAFARTFGVPFEHPGNALAVDVDEDVYVDSAGNNNTIVFFTPKSYDTKRTIAEVTAREQYTIGGGTAMVILPSASTELAGDALIDTGGSVGLYNPIAETNQQSLESFPGVDVPMGFEGFSGSEGLAVNASATVYASESAADKVQSFVRVPVPGAVTEAPSDVTQTGLTLRGTVNPEGEPVKECFFEYGTEAGKYTTRAACEHEKPLEGTEPVAVKAVLAGLSAAQVRSFRLVAVSALGVPGDGEGLTIALPVVSGEAVSGVGSVAATAGAEVNPGALASCYWVEYGTSGDYGEGCRRAKAASRSAKGMNRCRWVLGCRVCARKRPIISGCLRVTRLA